MRRRVSLEKEEEKEEEEELNKGFTEPKLKCFLIVLVYLCH